MTYGTKLPYNLTVHVRGSSKVHFLDVIFCPIKIGRKKKRKKHFADFLGNKRKKHFLDFWGKLV